MNPRAALYAAILAVSCAVPAKADPVCRIGSAADGKSYRLCEYPHEVRVEEIAGASGDYDKGINALVSHSRDLNAPSSRQAIPITGYIGAIGLLGFSEFTGAAGFTLGAKVADRWRGEISVYPLNLGDRERSKSLRHLDYNRIQVSTSLSYTFAKLGATSLYAGAELALAQYPSKFNSASVDNRYRPNALFGLSLGINHEIAKNLSLDVSYRNYLRATDGHASQGLRFSIQYSL